MEDTSECVDNTLELLTLEKANLFLGVSMSIFLFEMFRTIGLTMVSLDTEGFSVFTNSLMGATIQDGGKRERSDVTSHPFFLNQQFITWRAKADHGSYFAAMYKRNRLTRGLKIKGKEEEKEKESKEGLIKKKIKENRKPSSTWQNTLIVCKCESIRISDQEHSEMVQ